MSREERKRADSPCPTTNVDTTSISEKQYSVKKSTRISNPYYSNNSFFPFKRNSMNIDDTGSTVTTNTTHTTVSTIKPTVANEYDLYTTTSSSSFYNINSPLTTTTKTKTTEIPDDEFILTTPLQNTSKFLTESFVGKSAVFSDIDSNNTIEYVGMTITSDESLLYNNERLYKKKNELENSWKIYVLKEIFDLDCSIKVVFIEPFVYDSRLLQLSAANAIATVQLWGRPFDTRLGENYNIYDDKTHRNNRVEEIIQNDYDISEKLSKQMKWHTTSGMFTPFIRPETFVEWVLRNTVGIPILSSTNYTELFSGVEGDKKFLDYIVVTNNDIFGKNKPLLYDPKCDRCRRTPLIVTADSKLACGDHINDFPNFIGVRLYIPIMVSIHCSFQRLIISMYEFPEPFRARMDSSNMDRHLFDTIISDHYSPYTWTVLNKIPHRQRIERCSRVDLLNYVHKLYSKYTKFCSHNIDEYKNGAMVTVTTARCIIRNIWRYSNVQFKRQLLMPYINSTEDCPVEWERYQRHHHHNNYQMRHLVRPLPPSSDKSKLVMDDVKTDLSNSTNTLDNLLESLSDTVNDE